MLLALVDHKYQFRYVNIGSPGRCHDAYVFGRSSLSTLVQGPLFRQPTKVISGIVVPPLILCDQAFPLSSSLVKPFPHNAPLTPEQATFNYHLSESRIVVENAFGRMKARFRYVMKRMECDIVNVNDVIRGCCILHNMCEQFSDTADASWIAEARAIEQGRRQPDHSTTMCTSSGAEVRQALVSYFQR